MKSLIDIQTKDGKQAVNARDLHAFLSTAPNGEEIKFSRFNDWITRSIDEYQFTEGEDFYSELSKTPNGGRPSKEYIISIDMAKELAMVSRCDRGKQARQYFIECEKQLREVGAPALPTDYASALRALADQVEHSKALEEKVVEMKPRADVYDLMTKCKDGVSGSACAKMLKLPLGNKTLYSWFRKWGWMFNSSTEPTQYASQIGYLKVQAYDPYKDEETGKVHINKVTRVMPKAFPKILEKLKAEGVISENHEVEAA